MSITTTILIAFGAFSLGLFVNALFRAAKDRPIKRKYPSAEGDVFYLRGQELGMIDENSYS